MISCLHIRHSWYVGMSNVQQENIFTLALFSINYIWITHLSKKKLFKYMVWFGNQQFVSYSSAYRRLNVVKNYIGTH